MKKKKEAPVVVKQKAKKLLGMVEFDRVSGVC